MWLTPTDDSLSLCTPSPSLPLKDETLGQRVRHLREARRLSQEALAGAATDYLRAHGGGSLHPTLLSKIEHNHRPSTRPVIVALAHVLGTDEGDLLSLPGPPPKPTLLMPEPTPPINEASNFGQRLCELRRWRKMSRRVLAAAVSDYLHVQDDQDDQDDHRISVNRLKRIEHGVAVPPSREEIVALAHVLRLEDKDLLAYSPVVRPPVDETFGQRLRSLRQWQGLSLAAVAAAVTDRLRMHNDRGYHLSVPYLSNLERGRRQAPARAVIVALAQVLQTSHDDLLRRVNNPDLPGRRRPRHGMETLGQRVRHLREARGLSQVALATAVTDYLHAHDGGTLHPTVLSYIEHGHRPPTRSVIVALAHVLGTSEGELLPLSGPPSASVPLLDDVAETSTAH